MKSYRTHHVSNEYIGGCNQSYAFRVTQHNLQCMYNMHERIKIGYLSCVILLMSLSCVWSKLSICRQNDARKPSRFVIDGQVYDDCCVGNPLGKYTGGGWWMSPVLEISLGGKYE